MNLLDALEPLARRRTNEIVVTTMGAAREWPKLSDHPLDLHHVPSAMGHAPGIGLGLALAQPHREVIVLNGDGGMLMNLGSLVTVTASQASNFTMVLVENGVYEITGGQIVAGKGQVDFAGIAAASGFPTTFNFSELTPWVAVANKLLSLPGPRFVSLRVLPAEADYFLPVPKDTPEKLGRLRQLLLPG